MIKAKRYHPLSMLFDLWAFFKNSIIFIIYLFIINMNSQSSFVKYGRIVFGIIVIITLISIILKWWTHKYELDEQAFHLYKGVFSKSERTISFSKIQNVNRHTSLLHRILKVTSIHFETGMAGEEATISFEVISVKEADKIESLVAGQTSSVMELVEGKREENSFPQTEKNPSHLMAERTVHFTPTKKDTFKASFSSLSFLLLIPIIGSIYVKIDDIFHVEEEAKGIFAQVISSWFVIAILIVLLVGASVIFGIIRTFLKYGKYEITSDDERIYISKGMIDETAFSITKERVQAIVINQSFMKRLLGLAEVKLISAGNPDIEEGKVEINTLYPFLPEMRAFEIITEILPTYEVTRTMSRLPKKSFWIRLLQPSWLWLIATAALFYYQPKIVGIEHAWWVTSVLLLLVIVFFRMLDYFQTRYTMNKEFIQFKTGSFMTSLFLSKREKVIEVNISQHVFQKFLGLASIGTVNRAKPVHHAGVDDIPIELAQDFYKWYIGRRNEIEVE